MNDWLQILKLLMQQVKDHSRPKFQDYDVATFTGNDSANCHMIKAESFINKF